ncbi:hypothetical protein HDV06_001282 [Boothiomyces sp. JEL0866]|nr:hypothetical protein HDV06_001282 [Boothiomyces sp. JEL0866]
MSTLNAYIAPSTVFLTLGLQRNIGTFYILNVNAKQTFSKIAVVSYIATFANLLSIILTILFNDFMVSPYGNSFQIMLISFLVSTALNSIASICVFILIILRIPVNIDVSKYRFIVFIMGIAILGRLYQVLRQVLNYQVLYPMNSLNLFQLPAIKLSNLVISISSIIEAISFSGASLYFLYQIAQKLGSDKKGIELIKELYLQHKLMDYLLLVALKIFNIVGAALCFNNTENTPLSFTVLFSQYYAQAIAGYVFVHSSFIGSKEILESNKPSSSSNSGSRAFSMKKVTQSEAVKPPGIDVFTTANTDVFSPGAKSI